MTEKLLSNNQAVVAGEIISDFSSMKCLEKDSTWWMCW